MFDGHAYSFHIDYDFNADGGAVGNDIRLTAVPEPATWLLMGLGGLIVLGARPFGARSPDGCARRHGRRIEPPHHRPNSPKRARQGRALDRR